MTLIQYQGRRFDLLALRGARATGDVLLSQTLFASGTSGEVCTGVQKLAQRWVLEFLTIQGSMPFLPTRGCSFLEELYTGQLRTETDVYQAFLSATLTINANLWAEETADMHPEDRFARAELLSVTLGTGYIKLHISITSQAGDSRGVILPVSLSPVRLQP